MKNIRNALFISSLCVTHTQGAGIAIANATNPSTITAIAYSNDVLLTGGIVAAGYFNSYSAAQVAAFSGDLSNISLLITDFQIVGSTTADTEAPGSGIYTGDFSSVTLPNSTKNGNQLYSFLGNAANLADSTQWLLWEHTDIIDTQDTVTNPDSNNLVLGFEGRALISGGTFATTYDFDGSESDPAVPINAIRLASVVPEPSSALLGSLGLVALLRRKR